MFHVRVAGFVVAFAFVTALSATEGLAADGAPGERGEARRLIELSVSAADTAVPTVALPSGRVVTVAFQDAQGAPWPVVEVEGPQLDWLSYHPAAEHRHVVFLKSRSARGSGNLVALLDGLAAPVHLELAAGASPSATRVDVRLTDPRTGTAPVAAAGLEAGIRDYLLAHPEVLREALDPKRQLVAQVQAHRAELLAGGGVPVLGDAGGAVTVVEFFDYRCGYCKRSLDAVRAALARAGVRVQMREYPILGDDSARAARLALAAARQGAYEDAHFALMAHDGSYDEAAVESIAADLGLDLDRLRADMTLPELDALIEANRELAARLGVTGTPAFLIVGPERVEVSPGGLSADRLIALIDAAG